ncbi:chorismate-binding protein [Aquimarina sp. ERC-38]|uniref:chorismate-binding protein n=1 Tax=Aquimarina sp. ERC-38 TaxID=2949996 RepID=UPI0022482D55|nr:chorismate-binding protein [Aquimarina sp. ERC-38]UZO79521.1 chorismate-binding protein [Aquimarina sp. ERC-38]
MDITKLKHKVQQHLEGKKPLVLFKKPEDKNIKGYFQKDTNCYYVSDSYNNGFVFCPFDATEAKIIFPTSQCEVINTSLIEESVTGHKVPVASIDLKLNTEDDKIRHIELVRKAKHAIDSQFFKKVVVSRKLQYTIDQPDHFLIFQKLCQKYPEAMTYFWYHPKVGLWFGATPELLLGNKNSYYVTTALAGTRKVDNLEVAWQSKEKEEQQIVTDFIVQNLSKEFKNIKRIGPATVRAGNLLHLKTDIFIEEAISNNKILSIISLLHPTPAVCGLPRQAAFNFIQENEGYHRKFYTGYLGEINEGEPHKKVTLYVNLRCMEIVQDQLNIYVGGGITAQSDPEKEWLETIHKSETMTKVLFSS